MWWFYPPSVGGIETYLWDMEGWFRSQEIPAHFLVGPLEGHKSEVRGCVEVERNPDFSRTAEGKENGRRIFNRVKEIIEEKGTNVLHVHNFHAPNNLTHTMAACSAATVMEVPLVLHVHGFSSTQIDDIMLKHLNWDRIVCVSNFVAERVLAAGVDSKRIETVHNSVDTIKFNPNVDKVWLKDRLGIDEKDRVIVVSSRLISRTTRQPVAERKGHITVLQAASHLAQVLPNFKIVFTGKDQTFPGDCDAAIEKLTERAEVLKIDDKIVFPDKEFGLEDMPKVYAGCDVMALPSLHEPFGLVFTEAMACGKPVIGSNSGGVPEIINSGTNGMLVEEKNAVELFKALERILTDPIFAMKLGMNARKTVEEKFSTDKMCKGIMDVYGELL